jgi:hypothetical protein
MKQYEVTLTIQGSYYWEGEAESEEQAIEFANESITNTGDFYDVDCDIDDRVKEV